MKLGCSSGPIGRPDLHTYVEINGDQASNDVKHTLLLTQTEL